MAGKNVLDDLLKANKESDETSNNVKEAVVTTLPQKIKKQDLSGLSTRIDAEIHNKIKAIAFWHDVSIKNVLEKMLSDGIKKYEEENGAIKAIPKKKKGSF